jgi:Txe/YoeB family toxin of toxin-antitoxin system
MPQVQYLTDKAGKRTGVLLLSGFWSRRINDEHRLAYTIKDGHVIIAQYRYHY